MSRRSRAAVVSLIHAGVSFNYVHMCDEQTRHIAHIIGECLSRGIAAVEPSQEAEDGWIEEVHSHVGPRRAFLETRGLTDA